MNDLGYYNGSIAPLDEMVVPFNDRGNFFGDGVYEVALVRNYKVYKLDEHIERLFRSAEALEIKIKESKGEMAEIIRHLSRKLDSPDQIAYWQVTRGTQIREHTYCDDLKGNLWISLRPGKMRDIFTPISAITIPDERWLRCDIKSINLIPSVMYAKKAQRCGVYEAILYREGGRVTECSHSNVHIFTHDKVFKTAPTDNLILPGIARAQLIMTCHKLGITVDESPFYIDELMDAEEVIISSTTAPCMICNIIDGKKVGGGAREVAHLLRESVYNDFIEKTN